MRLQRIIGCMVFIELPIFIRAAAALLDDDALRLLQAELMTDPEAGDLIPGGGGLRKVRVPQPGRGKRGGARVIYYWRTRAGWVYLVYAYAKNVQRDLTPDQLARLVAVMKAEVRDG